MASIVACMYSRLLSVRILWLVVADSDIVTLGLMQLQDEVILSDAERLRSTQSNVKMVLFLFLLLSWIAG